MAMERKGAERWVIGCFIIFSGLALFFNLWAKSLENHDYLRYAEVSREMIRSGEWVVPHLNGEVFIDKPPLLFWIVAIPSSLYGSVTPLIARLPSALSAWMGILLVTLWGKRIYGTTRSGLIAGGTLLSCYEFFSQGRLAKTDMLLCLFILLSLYFFYLGYEGRKNRSYLFFGLSFLSMGMGVLTKGPFGLLIPLPIIALFLIKERQWRTLSSKEFILGYAILALAVLPWVLLFIHRVGLERSIALVRETRILTRKAPFYFYFIQIWVQFFPWSILLPLLCVYVWKERSRLWPSKESFFLLWFAVLFILLTLFEFRTSRYLLPALPPLALMIGGTWQKKFIYFLVPFLLFISIWHIREYVWMKRDLSFSPGMVLAGELKPFLREGPLFGYRLDVSTLEEINYYLDRVIPVLKRDAPLSESFGRKEGRLVLMSKKVYEKIQNKENLSLVFIRAFQYKEGELVLISS